ncbi:MAG: hypothetical protein NTV48_02925 [Candidatus Vogelbacteria bacterium]|nr:hypothetical protein [Candidatus Vogelbacteria bacterium]
MDDNKNTSSQFPPLMTTTDTGEVAEKTIVSDPVTIPATAPLVATDTTTAPAIVSDDQKQNIKTDDQAVVAETQVEKIRKAKIAMEGFGRTIQRETEKKEEKASTEKSELYKVLDSMSHEKEILELTWVNIDDKRGRLKKLLDPILTRESKIEDDEQQLESLEQITSEPKARHDLEGKRWQTQESRKKLEEEKWLVEEKILKFDEQIEANKKKYQELIAQEDKVKQKIKDIDEQLILQEEVLRQQRELEEEKVRQEALNKIQTDRQKTDIEKRRLAELKTAENEKKEAEEKRQQAEKNKDSLEQKKITEQVHFEDLRKKEEEKQKQETAKRVLLEQQRAEELKKKIMDSTAGDKPVAEQAKVAPAPEAPVKDPLEEIKELERLQREKESLRTVKAEEQQIAQTERDKELERVKRENEEAENDRLEKERQRLLEIGNVGNAKQSNSLLVEDGSSSIRPLRTLKKDTEQAFKENTISDQDLQRLDKKKFPWLT